MSVSNPKVIGIWLCEDEISDPVPVEARICAVSIVVSFCSVAIQICIISVVHDFSFVFRSLILYHILNLPSCKPKICTKTGQHIAFTTAVPFLSHLFFTEDTG